MMQLMHLNIIVEIANYRVSQIHKQNMNLQMNQMNRIHTYSSPDALNQHV